MGFQRLAVIERLTEHTSKKIHNEETVLFACLYATDITDIHIYIMYMYE